MPRSFFTYQETIVDKGDIMKLIVHFSFLLLAMTIPVIISTVQLDGLANSHIVLQKWRACQTDSLEFDFKTRLLNGLLFYADDSGSGGEFFELKLVGGMVRFRVNLGGTTVTMSAGSYVSNDQWHSVEIRRANLEVNLVLDRDVTTASVPLDDNGFGNPETNSALFIGGLPTTTNMSTLSLPSALFEPRFRGSIRSIKLTNCSSESVKPSILGGAGLLETLDLNVCELKNPCLNNGICVSTDNGPVCDCDLVDFEGETCEKEKTPSVTTLFGSEYMSYDLSTRGQPIISSRDTIVMYFKTRHSSGLLFYTGDGGDYINIAMKDGGINVTANLGSGPFRISVKPSMIHRFDDNRWHKLMVSRESREIMISVDDGMYRETGTTSGKYKMLSSNILYVGGSSSTHDLPGSVVRNNFKGCLKNVIYIADSIRLDITKLAIDKHPLISTYGSLRFDACIDLVVSQPVTFTTPESFIKVPHWLKDNEAHISFQFRTSEPNGLILYNSGAEAMNDFLAIELWEGFLYVVVDLGAGATKIQISASVVNDGRLHGVRFRQKGRRGSVKLDDNEEVSFRCKQSAVQDENGQVVNLVSYDRLDLGGSLYVGGYDYSNKAYTMPHTLITGKLKYGYVGCIKDLELNSEQLDLALYSRQQGASAVVEYCRAMNPQCSSSPCMNGGECTEGWNRYICNCSHTGYIGKSCEKDAATLSFDGTQYVKITLPDESRTESEEISLRFRTDRPNGLLFATSARGAIDRMELSLSGGKLRLEINLGSGKKRIQIGNNLNNDKWHSVEIVRRARKIRLQLDRNYVRKAKLPRGLSKPVLLRVMIIHVGSYVAMPSSEDIDGEARILELDRISLGKQTRDGGKDNDFSPFLGHMQKFVFNKDSYFDMAREGTYRNIELTAKFGEVGKLIQMPVTFKSSASFLVLPQLTVRDDFDIYFQFKTTDSNGLIFYNAGKNYDFIAVELVNGNLRYIFNTGDGTSLVSSDTKTTLNDNRWHDVNIHRVRSRHDLKVDGVATSFSSTADMSQFDLDGPLYTGGVEREKYSLLPKSIVSRKGFQGCLASVSLDSVRPDLLKNGQVARRYMEDIIEGCAGPTSQCTPGACANGGTCIQQWNSFTCNCDTTTYSGPRCNETSIAYRFEEGGLITFDYSKDGVRPDTSRDILTLGLVTTDNDAVLVHISSKNNEDYIEMELIDGKIYVVYNMGTMDHPIGELFNKVNDGKYHVIRFTRNGANSTLQIDNLTKRTKTPTVFSWLLDPGVQPSGRQLNIFNGIDTVYIGGKPNAGNRRKRAVMLSRPFVGTVSGLVLNGLHILEVASRSPKDPRIAISPNNVYLQVPGPWSTNVTPLTPTRPVIGTPAPGSLATTGMQSTMGLKGATKTDVPDEIIYSGAGSGCRGDDEDDCRTPAPSDNVITAVISIKTTTPPPTTTVLPTTTTVRLTTEASIINPKEKEGKASANCGDDDEDCDGSGNGVVLVDTTPSSQTDDVYLNRKSTLKPDLFVSVNMTVTPPKQDQDLTTRRLESKAGESIGGITYNEGDGLVTASTHVTVSPSVGKTANSGFSFAKIFTLPVIIGISVGGLFILLIIIYIFYKCKGRDEGSYKIDESKNYRIDSKPLKSDGHSNGGLKSTVAPTGSKPVKKKDVKEWYV